ncbi:hypothetical protein [Actinomadura sp. B10D3]|uniref:hypothetical protein n=1 Tax=Actinomadura sp. B10D3 TaxID=3153557 RepID=UPI00325D3BD6
MRRKSASLLMTMTLAAALLAAPATAEAVPQAGVHPVGPVTLTANSTLVDLSTGAAVVCDGGTFEGYVPSIQPPNLVVSSGSFGDPADGCVGPVGLVVQLTLAFPWEATVTAYDPATGVASGSLAGFELTYHDSSGCDVSISGPAGVPARANASLTNSTGEFAITGADDLEVAMVDADCDPQLIGVGDQIAFEATFNTTPSLSYSDA